MAHAVKDLVAGMVEGACSNLDSSDSMLLAVDSRLLHDSIVTVTRSMLTRDRYGIYVSLNRPHWTVQSLLEHANLNTRRIYFVDCVTALVHETLTKKDEHVIYASGPHDLDEDGTIPLAINKFIDSIPREKFRVLDTLRTLFIYNEPEAASSFVHNLLALTASHDLKVIVLTRSGDEAFQGLVSKAFDEVFIF